MSARRATLLLVIALLAACTRTGADSTATPVRTVSEPLPSLSGEDLGGTQISTDQFRGKVLVVNAWATWCTPCEQEQPALVRVAHRYAADGVRFLGIDHMDQDAKAADWVKRYDVPYPSIADPSGKFAASLDYFGLPDTYVVDPAGVIRYAIGPGATSEAQLSGLLDQVLAAQTSASSATATNSPAR
jgi:cytochrome c biogenesis protein CcmG/thiol:disulfide interchange protein DsbE